MPNAVNTPSPEPAAAKGPVDKALEVLELLARDPGPHRLAELARRTGLSKPTAHRHLRALAGQGFAEAAEGGNYRIGPRLLGLAAAALDAGRDLRLARPLLADLHRRTGHTAFYAVPDGAEVVHLDIAQDTDAWARLRPGDREPLHRSAAGLAVLSVPADGAHPAPEAAGPAAARDAAARLGYAVDDGYGEPDVRAVAAPVVDADGRVLGAIGVRGPAFTLDGPALELYGPMVRTAARSVAAGLAGPAARLTAVDPPPPARPRGTVTPDGGAA